MVLLTSSNGVTGLTSVIRDFIVAIAVARSKFATSAMILTNDDDVLLRRLYLVRHHLSNDCERDHLGVAYWLNALVLFVVKLLRPRGFTREGIRS